MEKIEENELIQEDKILTDEEIERLKSQNSRLVSDFQANKYETDAKKYWDLFYKRNETRFFKDRHWTAREFHELLNEASKKKVLLEIGCGVGNLIFPLLEEGSDFKFYACDISPRAIELVKQHKSYSTELVTAFVWDATKDIDESLLPLESIDIITLVFVLSAIHPNNFKSCVTNLYKLLRPGGVILFRDYGLYDMAQLRFKPGHKITENLYVRQDGTRSYYFSIKETKEMFESNNFETKSIGYIHRRTINKKEGIDVPRIFIQAKFVKPF